MALTKLAIPLAMMTVGAGAGAYAVVSPADTAVPAVSQVWIDAPTGIVPFGPGEVVVTAHATASEAIAGLTLYVDGEEVTTDESLERDDRLVYAELSWDATVGTHVLEVEQVGGGADRSAARTVVVAQGAPPAPSPEPVPDESTTTTTAQPGEETTTTVEVTTTATASTTTTTEEVAEGADTVPRPVPTTSPPTTTRPTPTSSPAPAPIVDSAAFVGTPRVWAGTSCPSYVVQVQVRARNAEGARIRVSGTPFDGAMTRSGSTFTGTIPSGWPTSAVGDHAVTVSVTGPGGTTQAPVGTLSILPSCPKD